MQSACRLHMDSSHPRGLQALGLPLGRGAGAECGPRELMATGHQGAKLISCLAFSSFQEAHIDFLRMKLKNSTLYEVKNQNNFLKKPQTIPSHGRALCIHALSYVLSLALILPFSVLSPPPADRSGVARAGLRTVGHAESTASVMRQETKGVPYRAHARAQRGMGSPCRLQSSAPPVCMADCVESGVGC